MHRRSAIFAWSGSVLILMATGLQVSVAQAGVTAGSAGTFVQSCDGGRGVTLPIPNPGAALDDHAARLNSGVVVNVFTYEGSTATNVAAPVVLEAVNANCTLDTRFGHGGRENLRWPGGFTSWPEGVLASSDGGFFVVGDANQRLAATELSATGTLRRSFGRDGWLIRSLPDFSPHAPGGGPGIAALAQERDGTLLVGSSNGEPHTSTMPRVYALTASGRLKWAFTPTASLRSSGVFPLGTEINQLLTLPSGSIAILAQLEFPACGTQKLAALNPAGSLEQVLTKRLNRDVASLPKNGLNTASGFIDGRGDLTFVGNLQHRCDSNEPSRGFIQHLGPVQALSVHSFHWLTPNTSFTPAFRLANGSVVGFGEGNASGTAVTVQEYLGSGQESRDFGTDGSLDVRACVAFSSGCASFRPTLLEGRGVIDVLVPRVKGLTILEVAQ